MYSVSLTNFKKFSKLLDFYIVSSKMLFYTVIIKQLTEIINVYKLPFVCTYVVFFAFFVV